MDRALGSAKGQQLLSSSMCVFDGVKYKLTEAYKSQESYEVHKVLDMKIKVHKVHKLETTGTRNAFNSTINESMFKHYTPFVFFYLKF